MSSQKVTVVPVPSERTLRNLAWVDANRRKVEVLSGVVRRISIVLLEQKTQYGDWESGPAIEVAPDGTFSVDVRPSGTTLYRLVGDDVDSAPLRVPVAGAS